MEKVCKFCKEEMFEDEKVCNECGYDYSNRKKTKKYRNMLLIENDKKRKKLEDYIRKIHNYSCKAHEMIKIIEFLSSDEQTKSDFEYYCKNLELCYYYFTGLNLNFIICNTNKLFNDSLEIQNNIYEILFKVKDDIIDSLAIIETKTLFENYDSKSQKLIEAACESIKLYTERCCEYLLSYTIVWFIFSTRWQEGLKNITLADKQIDECIDKYNEIICYITYFINEF